MLMKLLVLVSLSCKLLVLKDADSYTGDNTTPVSKDYVVDLKQSSSDMKRNLDDVYFNEVGLAS
ncbi:hypothetical protein Hanom_Chr01g00012031 [Helianthus anomalus]